MPQLWSSEAKWIFKKRKKCSTGGGTIPGTTPAGVSPHPTDHCKPLSLLLMIVISDVMLIYHHLLNNYYWALVCDFSQIRMMLDAVLKIPVDKAFPIGVFPKDKFPEEYYWYIKGYECFNSSDTWCWITFQKDNNSILWVVKHVSFSNPFCTSVSTVLGTFWEVTKKAWFGAKYGATVKSRPQRILPAHPSPSSPHHP